MAVPRQIAPLYGKKKSSLSFSLISERSLSNSRARLISTSNCAVRFTVKQLEGEYTYAVPALSAGARYPVAPTAWE
jgi:hypothetical protein